MGCSPQQLGQRLTAEDYHHMQQLYEEGEL